MLTMFDKSQVDAALKEGFDYEDMLPYMIRDLELNADEVALARKKGISAKQLVEEGFDGSSDEYYDELDNRLRKRFPSEMGVNKNGGSSRVASASTSASRSSKQGRRTVKLSPSQVAMAKKLGVPLEEYAKYVKE